MVAREVDTRIALKDPTLNRAVETACSRLVNHPVYARLTSLRAFRTFMEHHVWCVLDFMTLAKSIQHRIACTRVPWTPARNASAVAHINEILLNEEADSVPEELGFPKDHASHFEVYLEGMRRAGANCGPVDEFVALLEQGVTATAALDRVPIPFACRDFFATTLTISSGPIEGAVASLCIGRENLIPRLFEPILDRVQSQGPQSNESLVVFRWYIKRHIEIDSQLHGPASDRLFREFPSAASRPSIDAVLWSLEKRALVLDSIHHSLS